MAVVDLTHRCCVSCVRYLTYARGSTVDAMSDAIEGADVMLYGVSLAYKESVNCRMEANYAHQQELDMIPLMMQKDFKPKGWLGLILGTRMWYPFDDVEEESALEERLDAVCRVSALMLLLCLASLSAVWKLTMPISKSSI